ncbi:HET-domain-containing protein [Stipitochalara longipes BDJ]|nr:HET-domain-containing protein [Stipitochalara longipes BDJ]
MTREQRPQRSERHFRARSLQRRSNFRHNGPGHVKYKHNDSRDYHRLPTTVRGSSSTTSLSASLQSPQNSTSKRSPSPTLRRLGDTTFRYKDLDPKQGEIRLLRILPPITTSSLQCEMLHTSLANPRSYIAISYAWGDPEQTQTILLDGHEFPVTESLYLALQRLRSPSSAVVVWADAACINQKDVKERNHQVQSMTDIYSKAFTVAIWLGPEENDSDKAIRLLEDLNDASESPQRIRDIIKSPRRMPDFKALVELFDRDYWDRLWVVQEVLNAKSITVYCGQYASRWSTYATGSDLLGQYNTDMIRSFAGLVSPGTRGTWRGILSGGGPASMQFPKLQDGSLSVFLTALLFYRPKSCSEPRDKVYGILGALPPHERAKFTIDYNTSIVDAYINVIDYLLTTTGLLDVISCVNYSRFHSIERLPSWVPNWKSHDSYIGPLAYALSPFSAARSTKAKFAFSDRRRKLEISAVVIGEISDTGTPIDPLQQNMDDLLMTFFWMAWNPQEWMEWIYHIFATFLRERYPALILDHQLSYYADHSTLISEGLRRQTIEEFIKPWIVGRNFLMTFSGLLCLGSGGCWSGDIICVPLGCRTPIIIRKQRLPLM